MLNDFITRWADLSQIGTIVRIKVARQRHIPQFTCSFARRGTWLMVLESSQRSRQPIVRWALGQEDCVAYRTLTKKVSQHFVSSQRRKVLVQSLTMTNDNRSRNSKSAVRRLFKIPREGGGITPRPCGALAEDHAMSAHWRPVFRSHVWGPGSMKLFLTTVSYD